MKSVNCPVFLNKFTCNPGMTWTSSVPGDDLDYLILLFPTPECWDYRHAPRHRAYVVL